VTEPLPLTGALSYKPVHTVTENLEVFGKVTKDSRGHSCSSDISIVFVLLFIRSKVEDFVFLI